MKPVDLEKALAGEKVITRHGHEVIEIVRLKTRNIQYPIVTVTKYKDEPPQTNIHIAAGNYYADRTHSSFDLFMAPVITTVYVHLYHDTVHGGFRSISSMDKNPPEVPGFSKCLKTFTHTIEL